MRAHSLLFTSFVLYAASFALASPITYDINVNTSTINGTTGSLDFQFNPGPFVSQAASLEILNFTTDGTLVPPAQPSGDVSGTLPSTLTFDNGTGFNDYFEGFTFGNSLMFDVSLFGPALSAPDGTSTSGSTFAFSMFLDAAGTMPALTSDSVNGFAVTIDVNLDGGTTVTNSSSETTVAPATMGTVPEPGSFTLVGLVVALLLWMRRQRRA